MSNFSLWKCAHVVTRFTLRESVFYTHAREWAGPTGSDKSRGYPVETVRVFTSCTLSTQK